MPISVRQIKAARELLAWSAADLSKRSGVSLATIQRLEARGGNLGGYTATRDRIVAALEKAGIEFLNGNGVTMRRR
jgi:predicted transcriptional regulator